MIKNILVPLDGSEHSHAALEYALWLAEQFHGTLSGQHIIDSLSVEGTFLHDVSGSLGFEPYLDVTNKVREALEERGKNIIAEFTELCTKRNIRHQAFLDSGVIPNQICERANVADLVVIGHRGIDEEATAGLLGSTAEAVIRKSPRPVFVSTKRFKVITRPLLAYDGSQRASAAMESAAEFCQVLKLPLTLLTIGREESAVQAIQQQARSYLGAYTIDVKYEIARGHPEEKIIEYLNSSGFDLLFIGAYGHRRIISMVLGGTTEYVLRNSPCPVFLNR